MTELCFLNLPSPLLFPHGGGNLVCPASSFCRLFQVRWVYHIARHLALRKMPEFALILPFPVFQRLFDVDEEHHAFISNT